MRKPCHGLRIELHTSTDASSSAFTPYLGTGSIAGAVRDLVAERPLRRRVHAIRREWRGWLHARRGDLQAPLTLPNPTTLEAAVNGFDKLARYHRLDVRGLPRIPDGPAVLVANHNGGLNPVDGLFLVHYYRQRGYDDPVYILAHDILFKHPKLARVLRSVGIVPANRGTARRVLEQGHKLLVFPGGDLETMRPYRNRGKIVLAGRKGFARMAMAYGAPIVPIVSAGSHETLIVLRQGRRLAKVLGLPKWARVHSLPIMLAFPWGVLAGPTCALPYLPLPAKVTVQVGEPIETDDCDCERVMYGEVESTMQGMLDRLYAERVLPVLG